MSRALGDNVDDGGVSATVGSHDVPPPQMVRWCVHKASGYVIRGSLSCHATDVSARMMHFRSSVFVSDHGVEGASTWRDHCAGRRAKRAA